MPPNSFSTARAMRETSFSFATSHGTKSADPPSRRISTATRRPRATDAWQFTTTFAPSRAKASAVALPIPVLDPVTSTTLSRKRKLLMCPG